MVNVFTLIERLLDPNLDMKMLKRFHFFFAALTLWLAKSDAINCPMGQYQMKACKGSPQELTCSTRQNIYAKGCRLMQVCRCPVQEPFYENGNCLAEPECPKVGQDGISTLPTGHNFIVGGSVQRDLTFAAMHVSGLLLQAHWYHSVVRFRVTSSHCAKVVQTALANSNGNFLSIRYTEAPIKIVDLVNRKDAFDAQFALGSGQFFNPIITCKVIIDKILDLRRYNPDSPYPLFRRYLMFSSGSDIFVSHTAARCHDVQQLAKVLILSSQATAKNIEDGLAVALSHVPGQTTVDQNTQTITNPLSMGTVYHAKFLGENGRLGEIRFVKDKDISYDDQIINLFCSQRG